MKLKIAVPIDGNGILDGHFGHAQYFDIFDVADKKIVSTKRLTPPPHEPGVIPKWLVQNKITDVITGGIGQKASKILSHFNIKVHKGAQNLEATTLVEHLLYERLKLTDENCNHHHEHEHNHHHKHEHKHQDKHGIKRIE
jgi:predicted Fe-Mo cluster-binding NifX family protein